MMGRVGSRVQRITRVENVPTLPYESRVEGEVEFKDVDARFSEQTECPTFGMLRKDFINSLNVDATSLRDPRGL